MLNTALTGFRNAVNNAYPDRDKASDGTIGDANHMVTTSDHNPDTDGTVDAWDMDVEVNGVGKPFKTDIEHLKEVFELHESSRYWIHNREIASRSTGWKRQPYTGANPHDKHVHWNTRESHEDSTAPWVIGGPVTDVALTEAQNGALRVAWQDAHCAITGAVKTPGNPEQGGGRTHWVVTQLLSLQVQIGALTAAVGKLAEAQASGTGVTPEGLQVAVSKAVESAAAAIADAVATEQAERLQE